MEKSPSTSWYDDREPSRDDASSHPEAGKESGTDRTGGYQDASRGPRLQKVLADAGVASRRHSEELIASGAVSVNGHPVTSLPAWVDPRRDRITVRGKPISQPEEPVYVMLFKPRGVVCTNEDPEGRTRAIDLVRHPSRARLYSVGRLDRESSGLLLLTNDGDLSNRLTHPRFGIHKLYEVTIAGSLDEQAVSRLERGLFLTERRNENRGRRTTHSRLKLMKRDRDRTRLLMELHEGRNRQIRRMMALVGHRVKKLRRVQMGPLKLSGLQVGQWRDLTPKEIASLRRAASRGSDQSERQRTKNSRVPGREELKNQRRGS